ncbi:MAG: hypothetical protein HYY98_13810 [Burkholderiales bacterium]|jgi:hypothetical protein|uniref:Transcription-repair coupling factor n=1 Tax=Acidovorax facilis TaxID=12917 RepID=A0ABV8DHR6_9BURK|nr:MULTISPECIES: hypothetical protein [Acidovorax]MBI3102606.1 hypothetical protein [Burkholderiales bacterium]ODS51311.1 MAG: hypothetical protein ABS37_22695 [Acidovorax sp. SCN 65-108]OJU07342.1 MAG: hypothetical protein BGN90_12520 [Acidovorax sp. 65-7]OJV68229.1 MAG: hypothetical protein BGO35_26245 [Burkholderiales bacterium 64-34]KQB56166.1 hypothetical protein AE621_27620 [Acidovorax sp. SD340]
MNEQTYLTTDELSSRIKYDVRTIRERLKDSVLMEGVHYVRPFGGRKILFVWETIERDMKVASTLLPVGMNAIPMANGAVLHG